jgi:MFS family permease
MNPGFWETRLAPFFERHFAVLFLCLVGIAGARIMSTYRALSLTVDEPAHFACGLEYIARHVYRLETQHPPLSRMLQALGPYLAGARPLGLPTMEKEGLSVIARSGNVDRTVFLMRLGNLPFFLVACLVVCGWSWHTFGRPVAVMATGLFTLLPTMLADAGLATTDMALGATLGAAFFAAILWAERPTWSRALLMGLFTALACLSKFTALGYLPFAACLAVVFYLALRWPGWRGLSRLAKQRAATLALAAATATLLIWAAYWFSFGRVPWRTFSLRLPAPEFFDGLRTALHHSRQGHEAFLLGEFRMMGWWYYFPVALAVKTPIAFLILFALGTFVCLRERARPVYLLPLAFSLGILLPAMRSKVDIGIRHIEPIHIGFSIISAVGLRQLLQWARTGVTSVLTAGVLVAWMVVSVALHHPDYLAYFNGLAGKSPENILVDSNYDWGQDLKFLAKRMHELGVKEFSLASLDVMHHQYLEVWYGLPTIKPMNIFIPSPGWSVVSPTFDKSFRFHLYGLNMPEPWYEQMVPSERVGPLLLYYIPHNTRDGLPREADP